METHKGTPAPEGSGVVRRSLSAGYDEYDVRMYRAVTERWAMFVTAALFLALLVANSYNPVPVWAFATPLLYVPLRLAARFVKAPEQQ